jgi:hypothetical protein
MAVGIRHADHVALSIRKKLVLTSLTIGGHSVDIVHLRTETMDFFFLFCLHCDKDKESDRIPSAK